ncbi:23836_t:CDS:2, partial [Gigaspora rosea]
DDNIDLWPWNFGRELSSASIQNRVKNAISNGEFEKVNCDDPICSRIVEYETSNDNNEGTWELHSVTIPFNIAIREINNIKLTA